MYRSHYGVDGDRILVVNAPTMTMRPDTSDDFLEFLEAELLADPVAFTSEYGARFREDLVQYISSAQVEALVVPGRAVLDPEPGTTYFAFFDAAGGKGQDSAALAITTVRNGKAVLCWVDEWAPPFESVEVAPQVARILKSYRITKLTGDNFSGDTWASILRSAGVGSYEVEKRSATDLYLNLVPVLTPTLVELLDPAASSVNAKMVSQLVSLDRSTTTRAGRERIEHPRGAHDDVINAVAGALLLAYARASRGSSYESGSTSSFTKDYSSSRPNGPVVDEFGTRHLGGDTFRARSGEIFRDPRGL